MALNTESIVPQLRRDFETLIDYVTGPASADHAVYTVELHLFRSLLALGASLLGLFFRTRASVRPPTPVAPDGSPWSVKAVARSATSRSLGSCGWLAIIPILFEPTALTDCRPLTARRHPRLRSAVSRHKQCRIFKRKWYYFTATRQATSMPLDADLSLPATAYSDLLREWGAYGDTEQAYRENQTLRVCWGSRCPSRPSNNTWCRRRSM
jgi:hypothetical protein